MTNIASVKNGDKTKEINEVKKELKEMIGKLSECEAKIKDYEQISIESEALKV